MVWIMILLFLFGAIFFYWLWKAIDCHSDETMKARASFAELIYEAARLEAQWSRRPIVPEAWGQRDDQFRRQFVSIVNKYINAEHLPTPQEAHQSWMDAYFAMGWTYGEQRDPHAKTHPDLVPFDELPQAERDKDAIFLALVWLVREIIRKEVK